MGFCRDLEGLIGIRASPKIGGISDFGVYLGVIWVPSILGNYQIMVSQSHPLLP